MDGVLKRLLKTPITTPREAIYMEKGLADPETIIKMNRINYEHRIRKSDNKTMNAIMDSNLKNGWADKHRTLKDETGTTNIDNNQSMDRIKNEVKKRIQKHTRKNTNETAMTKSKTKEMIEKLQPWEPMKPREYMTKLTRNQASAIFRARTRMLNIKDNMRGA